MDPGLRPGHTTKTVYGKALGENLAREMQGGMHRPKLKYALLSPGTPKLNGEAKYRIACAQEALKWKERTRNVAAVFENQINSRP